MDNILFETIAENELMDIDGGDLVGGAFEKIGLFYRCWNEFWGGVGEGVYDWVH